MSSVKVAVRLRPFNLRERELDAKCVVEMSKKNTCKLIFLYINLIKNFFNYKLIYKLNYKIKKNKNFKLNIL